MILEANHISFQYKKGGPKVLDRFTLTAGSEERVGLVAPSGFGKTTLCKLLAGYIRPTEGEVLLEGKPVADYKGYCPVQMIWQQPELSVNPRMRMKDVLAEGNQVEPRILKELGIEEDWLNRFPGELSGGEMQRFCIARALGEGTRFLLADEISTMLDLITQSQIWSFLMEEVQRRDIGLIAVSHSKELLDRVCTRQVYLEEEMGGMGHHPRHGYHGHTIGNRHIEHVHPEHSDHEEHYHEEDGNGHAHHEGHHHGEHVHQK
jgi:ABC-type dipeptide/oligopeptide/nickel transport system ATPase subunit